MNEFLVEYTIYVKNLMKMKKIGKLKYNIDSMFTIM